MLLSLNIKNFLLIETANIVFDRKFSVITGETGSGKSLILDSLLFVLGQRQSKTTRREDLQTIVVAEFDISNNEQAFKFLKELDIEAEESLIIRRVIDIDGKIKNYLNDVAISSSSLKSLAKYLIEIYSQHQQQSLMSTSYYLDIIDNFAHNNFLKIELNQVYQEYIATFNKLNNIKEQLSNIEKERDYLEYVELELTKLNVYQGEEQELTEKRITLMNKEKLIDVINDSLAEITKNNVSNALINAQKTLIRNNNFPNINFDKAIDYFEKTSIELDEAILELNNILESINDENDQLDNIEQRLFAIKASAKKHNIAPDEFANFLDQVKAKLLSLNNQDQEIKDVEEKLVLLKSNYKKLAKQLSDLRINGASLLEREIIAELVQLKMPHINFKISVETQEDEIKLNGVDKVSFLISPNPGVALLELSKVASGGELSRFMLAICVVLSRLNKNIALLFDEIDTGLSGAVADAVGAKLLLIAENTQVITITHQPQIASKGNTHIKVYKNQSDSSTQSEVKMLNHEERTNEIATMISGEEVSIEAIEAAKKLMML